MGSNLIVHWDAWAEATTISNSRATDSAGALFCGAEAHCSLSASSIAASSAAFSGGAISADSAEELLISGSALLGNSAGQFGGSLHAMRIRLVASIVDSNVTGGRAGIGGGAAYVTTSAIVAMGSRFEGNVALGLFPKGGALFLTDGGSVSATNCSFVRNAVTAVGMLATADDSATQVVQAAGAGRGGLAYVSRSALQAPAALSLTRCNVSFNSAEKGGAIGTMGNVTVSAVATTFMNNSAKVRFPSHLMTRGEKHL